MKITRARRLSGSCYFSKSINGPSHFVGMANDPVATTDPTGESPQVIAAVVGGVVGGLINTAVHWDDITRGGFNWGKAGVAFGIGAAAGAMAGLTGGASLSTMPVATSAATLAGQTAISSVMAYGVSSPIQNIGNHIAFGDPLASPKDVLNGLAMSAATGAATGLISGLAFQRLPLFDPAPTGLVKQVGYISNIADDAEAAAAYFEAHPQKMPELVVTVKGGNTMAGKSLEELQTIAKQNAPYFRELFGTNEVGAKTVLSNIQNVKVPDGLGKEAMQAYRELIKRVPDPRGTQIIRAEILDHILKR